MQKGILTLLFLILSNNLFAQSSCPATATFTDLEYDTWHPAVPMLTRTILSSMVLGQNASVFTLSNSSENCHYVDAKNNTLEIDLVNKKFNLQYALVPPQIDGWNALMTGMEFLGTYEGSFKKSQTSTFVINESEVNGTYVVQGSWPYAKVYFNGVDAGNLVLQ